MAHPVARIRRGSVAAWRLAMVGVAVGVLLTAVVGRSGCYQHELHGGGVAAAIEVAADHVDLHHPTCLGCAAAAMGAATISASTTELAATERVADLDLSRWQAPSSGASTLRFAPKTSPPRV